MSDLRCPTCGATLTPMDMAKPSCAYCGTVLPHHARAAQQVAVVNQMMADRNGNGIPDAFEGLLAGAPQGQVHLIGTSVHHQGPVVPGAQVGFGAPPYVAPPYVALQQIQVAHAVQRSTGLVTGIVLATVVAVMIVAGAVAALVFVRAG